MVVFSIRQRYFSVAKSQKKIYFRQKVFFLLTQNVMVVHKCKTHHQMSLKTQQQIKKWIWKVVLSEHHMVVADWTQGKIIAFFQSVV